jgi:hypothetical protein
MFIPSLSNLFLNALRGIPPQPAPLYSTRIDIVKACLLGPVKRFAKREEMKPFVEQNQSSRIFPGYASTAGLFTKLMKYIDK